MSSKSYTHSNSKHTYASGEAAGEETLEAVHSADLHTGSLVLYGRFPQEWSSMGNSAAELSDWADLYRIALLTPLAWGRG